MFLSSVSTVHIPMSPLTTKINARVLYNRKIPWEIYSSEMIRISTARYPPQPNGILRNPWCSHCAMCVQLIGRNETKMSRKASAQLEFSINISDFSSKTMGRKKIFKTNSIRGSPLMCFRTVNCLSRLSGSSASTDASSGKSRLRNSKRTFIWAQMHRTSCSKTCWSNKNPRCSARSRKRCWKSCAKMGFLINTGDIYGCERAGRSLWWVLMRTDITTGTSKMHRFRIQIHASIRSSWISGGHLLNLK